MKNLTNGRIARLNYFIAFVVLLICHFVIYILIKSILVGYIAATLVFVVLGLSLVIRRLQDMGWNGWWALLVLPPVVNFIFWLVLLFKPGTSGDNAYGTPPSTKLDIWNTLFPKTRSA